MIECIVTIEASDSAEQVAVKVVSHADSLNIYCYPPGSMNGATLATMQLSVFGGELELLYWPIGQDDGGEPERLSLGKLPHTMET